MEHEIWEKIQHHITPARRKRMEEVLSLRTKYLALAIEDVYYPPNASALVRHADSMGIQEMHVIENESEFILRDHVARGSKDWLTLYRHREAPSLLGNRYNSEQAIQKIKDRGFRIIATSPRENSTIPENFNLEAGKSVIFLGAERKGLSSQVLDAADDCIYIPLSGFVESLNISAAGAIILYTLTQRLRQSGIHWQLTEDEKQELREKWILQSIKNPEMVLNSYRKELL